ncbi:fimbrial biogenesis outer membrane usher protein [Morganella morganii subsp. morganii]|uniref:fimbria/pilus outer membrane usher protein n=1 Tax=Morganella morganii TaxID=582 RepID=UPI001BDB5BCE|nr:fimbria/pilus outer membrane usher protein [Morganella morganii]MBT0499702.1 fimbrial biogenesis outer membrane usher protein [Morganella morganii subsp. morganii]QWM16053.1 fimbrial biogenesis outer membrane usher protein [Morganella morganii subsp. morganii]
MQLKAPYFFLLAVVIVFPPVTVFAAPYFNPAALGLDGDDPVMDPAQFQYLRERQFQEEGRYFVAVTVNQQAVSGQWLEFRYHPQQKRLLPWVNRRQWLIWGLRPDASPAFAETENTAPVADITALVSGVSLSFDSARQSLDITIPQRFFLTEARRAADTSLWEPGITAFMLNYDYRFSRDSNSFSQRTGHTLLLQSGVNAGDWRLRHHSRAEHREGKLTWQSERLWMYRAIASRRSELQLGELFSGDVLFDSRAFRGIRLASQSDMYPLNQQGYAPVIRGITGQSAELTIRQQGMTIRRETLPAGEFVIDDLNTSFQGTELDVTIEEADGTVQRFTQHGTSVPVMQREGRLSYTLDTGKYRGNRNNNKDLFVKSTAAYGINSVLTLYGGGYAAQHALSSGVGAGVNMGAAGGVSADILMRHTTAKHYPRYRLNYQKFFPLAGTLVNTGAAHEQQSRQWQVRLLQPLPGDNGTLSAGYHYNRTGHDGRGYRAMISRDAGYSGHIGRVHYGVNAQYRTGGHFRKADKRVSVALSVPLDFAGQQARSHFHYHQRAGKASLQTSVNGLLGDEQRLGYSVTHSYQQQGAAHYRGAELRWRHDLADIRGRINHSQGHNTLNGDIQGGLIIHGDGITLSRPLGETNGLADTVGTGGIRVASRAAAQTDSAGFSVIPQLSHYHQNVIRIDPETLPDNADADDPVVQVIPSKGALVPVRFAVNTGYRVIYALRTAQGPVPFAARVKVKKADGSSVSGITGEDGEVYLSGLPAQGHLQAVWGKGMHEQCGADFTVPEDQQGLITLPLICR